ncbi:MAG: hypothetical protein ACOYZ7_15625 [Chloroflexota bacterium]
MDPQLSQGLSLTLVLLASFLWNTWAIALKYLDHDYPLDAFLLDVYIFSCALMWGVGFLREGSLLVDQLARLWQGSPGLFFSILLVGALFSGGVRIDMGIIASIGLMLTVAVRASIVILVGTAVSMAVGGLPEGASPGLILTAAALLALAVLIGMWAGQEREHNGAQLAVQLDRVDWRVVGRAIAGALLIVTYAYGLSAGMRSTSHPEGLDAVAYMVLLSTGSLLGALLWGGGRLTRTGQWGVWYRAPARYRWMAAACAVAHYGGNLIHALGVPALSTAIAWPLGTAGNLWTYLWGLVFGEFKGAPRKAWALMGLTATLFIGGAALLALGQSGS